MPRSFLDLPSLRLLAGKPNGSRNSILVHGMHSSAEAMSTLAEQLVAVDQCDGAWGYDSWAYYGDVSVNRKVWSPAALAGLLGPKILLAVGRIVASRAAAILETPSHTIEGAGQETATIIKMSGWRQVTLLGHSLGGLVARCAVESHDLSAQVRVVVSLATPHWLWSKTHRPEDWDELPVSGVRYLQVLGSGDWVVARRGRGDLTADDTQFSNLVKVVYPGLDHSTIHSRADESNVPELIREFTESRSLRSKSRLLVAGEESSPELHFSDLFPGRSSTHSMAHYSGYWTTLVPCKV